MYEGRGPLSHHLAWVCGSHDCTRIREYANFDVTFDEGKGRCTLVVIA